MKEFFIVQVANILRFILISSVFLCCSEKRNEENFSILFTGDVLLDRGVRKEIEMNGIASLFKNVKSLFLSKDAVIINLECPVTENISPINKRYIFRGNPDWLPELYKNGITHTTLANNHIMDQGRSGITDTYNNLKNSGIIPLGYGRNQKKSCEPVIIKKKGIQIALFNSLLLPVENWICIDDSPGICQVSSEDLSLEIQSFKQKYPKFYIIVILHWGGEFQLTPHPIQINNAHKLIQAGADAIIGHHPHVIQKKEIFNEKPIYYSLGNFIFDQNKPITSKGMIVTLSFSLDQKRIDYKEQIININNCIPEI